MPHSPEEIRLIETLTQGQNMTEQQAIDYLASNRREASKTTRSDARLAVAGAALGALVCAVLLFIQFNHGRFSIKLVVALWVGFAFCCGALMRNLPNLNAR